MDELYIRDNFEKIQILEFVAPALKSFPKLAKLQTFVGKCYKMQKI